MPSFLDGLVAETRRIKNDEDFRDRQRRRRDGPTQAELDARDEQRRRQEEAARIQAEEEAVRREQKRKEAEAAAIGAARRRRLAGRGGASRPGTAPASPVSVRTPHRLGIEDISVREDEDLRPTEGQLLGTLEDEASRCVLQKRAAHDKAAFEVRKKKAELHRLQLELKGLASEGDALGFHDNHFVEPASSLKT